MRFFNVPILYLQILANMKAVKPRAVVSSFF